MTMTWLGRATAMPALAAIVVLSLSNSTHAAVLRVDGTAASGGDGSSWSTAYQFLQDALAVAAPGDEIRVAAGLQLPDHSAAAPSGSGDRAARFTLLSGVVIEGGYAGLAGSDPDARDPRGTPTVLSGDLLRNDGPGFANTAENSLHVVDGGGADATAILDGVTITGGNANTSSNDRFGAGALVMSGGPQFRNCRFTRNLALFGGGAFIQNANPRFEDCIFDANEATQQGAGAYSNTSLGSEFDRCVFAGNTATNTGGGMYLRNQAVVVNSLFTGNSGSSGGGVNTIAATTTLTNCAFSGNSATVSGAAINAQSGGSGSTQTLIENCVVHGQGSGAIGLDGGTIIVNRSLVEGGWSGAGSGNIAGDPLFIDADGADDIVGTLDDNLRLQLTSPAVDAGDNLMVPAGVTMDLDLEPRFVGVLGPAAIVDLGPYELEPNQEPIAHITFEQLTDVGAEALVRLDGTLSNDPDHLASELQYRWTVDGQVVCDGDFATCAITEVLLGFGSRTVTLDVTDPLGATGSATSIVILDPATLSVFESKRARVRFGGGDPRVDLQGQIALPSGLDYTELTPFALLDLLVADLGILAIAPAPVIFDVAGNQWCYPDDGGLTGIEKFEIDWQGARLGYAHPQGLVRIRSQMITASESILTIRFKRKKIGTSFTIDIDGQASIAVDASGHPTGNVPIEIDRTGRVFTFTVPFAVDSTSTITLGGGLDEVIDVVSHFTPSVGRFRIRAALPDGLFPDEEDTTPRRVDVFLNLGASAYPGSFGLDADDLEIRGSGWLQTH